jgi:redox-sensitive bicupin YhaK (pirin superfamily)
MASPILQTVPLGAQWPTLDPFLFCAHHLDHYPASDGQLGPKASLAGRQIGSDFAGVDGWNMYHGSTVPGFPQHPHRGFETVTYLRRGWCDHSDSLGAQARFGEGDVQWLTAGGGIVHSEMFPLFDADGPNTLHLFQIWLNLPAANKMVDPYFSMLWNHDVPKVTADGMEATIIAGSLSGSDAPTPPPDSWAAGDTDVAIWHLRFDEGATWELPAADPGSNRVLYLFEGSTTVAGQVMAANTGVVLDAAQPVELTGGAATATATGANTGGGEALLLQGRPIGEPVAQYGPFVLNDEAGIRQAMADYQRTGFGGWPWPTDDPVHGPQPRRYARRADGSVEHPDGSSPVPDHSSAGPSPTAG